MGLNQFLQQSLKGRQGNLKDSAIFSFSLDHAPGGREVHSARVRLTDTALRWLQENGLLYRDAAPSRPEGQSGPQATKPAAKEAACTSLMHEIRRRQRHPPPTF